MSAVGLEFGLTAYLTGLSSAVGWSFKSSAAGSISAVEQPDLLLLVYPALTQNHLLLLLNSPPKCNESWPMWLSRTRIQVWIWRPYLYYRSMKQTHHTILDYLCNNLHVLQKNNMLVLSIFVHNYQQYLFLRKYFHHCKFYQQFFCHRSLCRYQKYLLFLYYDMLQILYTNLDIFQYNFCLQVESNINVQYKE